MSPQYLLVICYSSLVFARRGGGGSSVSRGGGGHTYPSSHGLSGNTYSGTSYHRSSNTHTYPQSTGLSGNTYRSTSYNTQRNEVHNHYHYSPPQHISYGSQQHPVFVGTPPSYVYVYKNSGSRYDNLLTGLALYNLGRMSNSHGYHDHHYYERDNMREYRGSPGEICKLGISKSNGEYEETRIDCKLISSFIWEAEREKPISTVTKTVNVTQTVNEGNTTVTIQNSTVEAVQVKGSSIPVNPGMKCFMIRIARDCSTLKKKVECGLLQEYASRSLRYDRYTGRCTRVVPVISISVSFLITLM
ncbi:uncharacterized protein [Maniola hyperantus]|uniref:uncharacterized protein n=1 Tax=Aphantopus hyperantus TaxID=2795564 RepID=UPI0015689F5F|nr:uncharacterized protein LOC117991464 [Maniola hyperantus]